MKTILIPVDFSSATAGVVETGLELARAARGRIILLHAIGSPGIAPTYSPLDGGTLVDIAPLMQVHAQAAEQQLERLAAQLRRRHPRVQSIGARGLAPQVILSHARRLKPAYIVMGSHGHSALYDALVGGTSHAVLQGAPCPVVIVPSRGRKKAKPSSRARKRV